MINTRPYYGRGIGFPFRIDSQTGGVLITEGIENGESVLLQYMFDSFSLREDIDARTNHIAESIAHILLTMIGEHDTIPLFGSRVNSILFDPNHEMVAVQFEVWLQQCTARWEKRVVIPNDGVEWAPIASEIDRGNLPVMITPSFLRSQDPKNLVQPFITNRQARTAEYPSSSFDAAGNDQQSRYFGGDIYERRGKSYLRINPKIDTKSRIDDIFYMAKPGDSWLTISWGLYRDIRYSHRLMEYFINDAAKQGLGRDAMNITGDPTPGTLLRAPSRPVTLMQMPS